MALQLGEAIVVVGVERLFEPVHAVLFARLDDANRGFQVPTVELAVGRDPPAPIAVHHYVDSIADRLAHSGQCPHVFPPVRAVEAKLQRLEASRDRLLTGLEARFERPQLAR